jgi:hypothetical protein
MYSICASGLHQTTFGIINKGKEYKIDDISGISGIQQTCFPYHQPRLYHFDPTRYSVLPT